MFFCRHFNVKKTSLPLPAERLSNLAYIVSGLFIWIDAICKEGLWKKCIFAPKFLVHRGEIEGCRKPSLG